MIRKHLRLKRLVLGTAVSLAVAAFAAPAVQAATGPAYSLLHRSTQTQIAPAGKYGPLDPWAYSLVHRSTSGNGPLDPWAYGLVHRNTQSTPQSYSAVSGPLGVKAYQSFAGITAKQGDHVTSQSGLNWGDAGIGASVAFGALLLLLTVLTLGRRYRPRINLSGLATS